MKRKRKFKKIKAHQDNEQQGHRARRGKIKIKMAKHLNSANELLLWRKLEEQQQAAKLQQAIELQSRRLMGFQLLDLKAHCLCQLQCLLLQPTH
ncbi:hypothetical protein BS78_05G067600 [Paspalum vaginatum]|nr:hypothetical protein BS78_05G067600 [Paspalum vaginatum]